MEPKYYSFLVRFREAENSNASSWHISLESPESGEKQYFFNLVDLMKFFEKLMGAPSDAKENAEETDQ